MHNNSGTWRTTWAFVAFLLVMALLVPFAMRRGWGMSGIFFAMVLATATAYLIPHTIKLFRQRLEEQGISLKDWGKFMAGAGYEASIVDVSPVTFPEEAAPSSTELIVYEEHVEDEYEGEEDEHQEAIIEPHGMHLADDFRPSVDSFLSMCFVMIGIRRSGKSNGIADVCEELARWSVPIVIADTEDEYSALADRRYMPRGILAGSLDMLKANPELRSKHFIPIDLNGAYNFGYALLDSGLQVVLNLKSFADDDEAAMIMTEIITGMNAWEEQRPQSQRVPCMFVLDEANKWLPQQTSESCLSRDVLIELQQAIFGVMVRRGGKRGLGLGLATQRIAELDKRALQSEWKFLFRQKEQLDLERYKALGLDQDEVMGLGNGDCFVWSPSVQGLRIHMRAQHSPHGAHTPGLQEVMEHQRRRKPLEVITAQSFVTAAFPTFQVAGYPHEGVSGATATTLLPETDLAAGVQRVAPSATEKTPVSLFVQRSPTPRHSGKYDRALQAWNDGHKTMRDMAEALSIPESAAYNLLVEMDKLKLIQWERKKKRAI